MPSESSTEIARAEIEMFARRAGITLSDEDIGGITTNVQRLRDGLSRVRQELAVEEEPALTFSQPSGKMQP